ncbi:Chain_A [Hexamita inflata]|uniref:Rab family protein n=1 Tax=Hexamita inflata TaxID=28002 RepID=A0AA86QI35_9EUKA|nr:Chain A [Hexamita inflata]
MQKDVYDKYMANKYVITNGCLEIYNDSELNSIDFINKFKVTQLSIEKCRKLIPKLNSLTIKELSLELCNVKNIEKIQTKNLEVLILAEDPKNKTQFNTEDICKFQKLKHLDISGYNNVNANQIIILGLTIIKLSNCGIKNIDNIRQLVNLVELDLNTNQNIDVSPLSELKQLTNLDLGRCNIKNTYTIQKLENLDELLLYGNQDIDITPLQYLKKLKVLNLNACNLQNIDMLQTLVYLQKLYISDNQIMYAFNLYKNSNSYHNYILKIIYQLIFKQQKNMLTSIVMFQMINKNQPNNKYHLHSLAQNCSKVDDKKLYYFQIKHRLIFRGSRLLYVINI